MTVSEITLDDVLFDSDVLDKFGCCKLLINDEVMWDDDTDWNEYISFTDAWVKYIKTHPDWKNYRIRDINIQIVHFHHSIINISCDIK